MYAGTNMYRARPWLILARAAKRGLEWAPRGAQKLFMLENIDCITIIITLYGIEKIKAEKNDNKTVSVYKLNAF